MTAIGSLFTGYGGLDMAAEGVLGGSLAWVSDIDPGACRILAHRHPDAPNLGDITAIDWADVEPVDVITGGFPCQDVSHAGRRAGLGPGTRTGLWSRMADAIDHLRPRLVVVENVRGLLSAPADSDVEPCPWCLGGAGDGEPPLRALGAVLADLADLGYDAAWHGLRAADVGAPHGRFRVFVVAWPAGDADGMARAARRALGGRPGPVDEPGAVERAVGPDRLRASADADRVGRERPGDARGRRGRPADAGQPDAYPDGRDERWPAPAGIVGRPDAAQRLAWGPYAPAVARWAAVLGRPAPAPTEPGRDGKSRLSPAFVEWMMGLPAGHVTDVPGLSRNDQLRALGNGVVPQQAAAALRILLNQASRTGVLR